MITWTATFTKADHSAVRQVEFMTIHPYKDRYLAATAEDAKRECLEKYKGKSENLIKLEIWMPVRAND